MGLFGLQPLRLVDEMNPYHRFVSEFARVAREGADCPLGGMAPPPRPPPPPDAPKALLFSPHPDDESVTGGLALRPLEPQQAVLRSRDLGFPKRYARRRR